jgi:hypothetical protein
MQLLIRKIKQLILQITFRGSFNNKLRSRPPAKAVKNEQEKSPHYKKDNW